MFLGGQSQQNVEQMLDWPVIRDAMESFNSNAFEWSSSQQKLCKNIDSQK